MFSNLFYSLFHSFHDMMLGVAIFGGLAVAIYILRDIPGNSVMLGVSASMMPELRHGVVWVKTIDGGLVRRDFKAENPNKLLKPSHSTLRDIRYQLTRMSMIPDTLEISIGNTLRVYKFNDYKPKLIYHSTGHA